MQLSSISLAITRLGQLWTPRKLFLSGEQGVWYDPSDFSTLFQDSAGTTPVTAVEQPVGLMLDKSGRGNHATQATAASRPVVSARVNLLTKTEDFSNASWTKSAITITANNTTAPDGTLTADLLTAQSGTTVFTVSQDVTAISASMTLVVYIKANGYTKFGFREGLITGAYATFDSATDTVLATNLTVASIANVGGGWHKCTITYTGSAAAHRYGFFILSPSYTTGSPTTAWTSDGTSGIYIWGAQLETGSTATRYQRVNTSTDYDTVGFPHYLKFDGVDDSMATGSIDFTATDKMTVFAGVRKLSDAATGMAVELGTNSGGVAGSFGMSAPSSSGANSYRFASMGATTAFAGIGIFAAAPNTSVLTGIADISGNTTTLKRNGVLVETSLTSQGGGNYGNYPLYIGARAGTSLFFNGNLYSLIVRGAQSSAAQITSAETYVNSKTRAF